MESRHLAALASLLSLFGCQVVSGLTGVDLEGNGKGDGGPGPNECEKADEHIQGCPAAGCAVPVTFPKACPKTVECEAACYAKAPCVQINKPRPTDSLARCLKACATK